MDWTEFRALRRPDVRQEPPEEIDRLAYLVIGAAIEVHRVLGPGHAEGIYEEAVCIELSLRGILFERQVRYDVLYKGAPIGEGRIDLVIGGELVVELKAIDSLGPVHTSQIDRLPSRNRKEAGAINQFQCRGPARRNQADHRFISPLGPASARLS